MRLTALCLCGTLLAFSSLSWTTVDSDEGDLLWDNGFEPCAASLRPEGPCKHGQDESMCPYLFSLPPLTVQLPKQLGELEKIVTDLQKLKDSVDQLRRMCTDCTVSQSERECERKREREHDEPHEGTSRYKDERNWLNERNPERLKGVSLECGTDRVKGEKTMEDGDIDPEKSIHLDEKGREEWEAERESDEGVKNEDEETLKEEAEKSGKTQTAKARERDKLGQTKVPSSDGYERTPDILRKRVGEKNNTQRETNRKKGKMGDGKSAEDEENLLENRKEGTIISDTKIKEKADGDDHRVRQDETKGTERKTQTEEERGGDGIKMSKDHGEHTNKEQERRREERKEEMEKGIKVERNNEKPKQTESIGRAEKEKTIKEGEVEEEDRQTGKEIKKETEKKDQSVQRDSDGELAPSGATEHTDFVSISPTPHSLTPGHGSMDLNEAVTPASYIPFPVPSSSTSHVILGVDQGVTTNNIGLDVSESQSPDAQAGFRRRARPTTPATAHTLGGPEQETTSTTTRFISPTSTRSRAGTLDEVSSTTATTTTAAPLQTFTATAFTGVPDRSSWTTRQNILTNAKTFSGREPKPGEKHKATIKTETDRKLNFPKNDHKSDRALFPDKKTGPDQKKKPPYQKPATDQKSKPGKDAKIAQIPKQSQRPLPDHLLTDQNLKNVQIPRYDQINTTDPNHLTPHKPKFHQKSPVPVQRPSSEQTPQTVNAIGSDKDDTDQAPEISFSDQKPKPEKRPGHAVKPEKPGPKQKIPQKPKNDEKTRPDQRSTIRQNVTPVHEPKSEGSEATRVMPKPTQKPVTASSDRFNENPLPELKPDQDSSLGRKPSPVHDPIKPHDRKPRPNQKIPKINQKPDPTTGQKSRPSVKPKPDQTPLTNQGFKMPRQDREPDLSSKSVSDENPEAGSNKTSTAMPLPRHRPPTRTTVKPGATSVQRPKPSVQLKPSPKTKTDLHPPQISRTTSDGIQNSQTDKPPASGPVKHIADVTHSPEFSPSEMKTSTLGPKPSVDLDTRPFPSRPSSLSEGFTMSPNSRITSDLRPQTASQAPSIPMTTRPNKIMHGILPSVIPSTGPGSTQPKQDPDTESRPKAETLHSAEETASTRAPDPDKAMTPAISLRTQSTSTSSPRLRSAPSTTLGPEPLAPEASTPSPHELRVKINQVAAFFNNTLSPNGRPLERLPIEQPKGEQGGGRPERTDGKLPMLKPKKVPAVKRDCSDYLPRGEARSGVYLVTPDLRSRSFQVLCDMELQGGGWTVLQRRQDGSVSFNRSWAEYKAGFGRLDGGEFWLGNSMIHLLTRDREMKLRVELEDFEGVMEYAEYEHFRVASERMRYRLTVDGYSGTAGDALRFSRSYDHNNRAFTTPDKDHDRYPSGNCGAYYSSGWWFDACMAANLNGRYYVGKYKGVRDGIFWGTWHNISMEYYPTNDRQAFKNVRMLIRPTGFAP